MSASETVVSKTDKTASSQAAWALITEGVTQARLDTHRLRHLVNRAGKLISSSDQKEHLFEVAGDIIIAAPERMDALEQVLDRTALALVKMGESYLGARLPLSEKQLVEETLSPAFGGGMDRNSESESASQRVSSAWVGKQADLMPALGLPTEAGPCYVVNRIEDKVRSPRVRDVLQEKVEEGKSLSNPEARVVYKPLKEQGAGLFKQIELTSHAQYRMDLRGISIPDIRVGLKQFGQSLNDWKSQKSYEYEHAMMTIRRGEPIEFLFKKWNLFLVFAVPSKRTARIITVYWKGMPDPKAPGICVLPHSHNHGIQNIVKKHLGK